eukprot:2561047-Rhodomonas_salina.1
MDAKATSPASSSSKHTNYGHWNTRPTSSDPSHPPTQHDHQPKRLSRNRPACASTESDPGRTNPGPRTGNQQHADRKQENEQTPPQHQDSEDQSAGGEPG